MKRNFNEMNNKNNEESIMKYATFDEYLKFDQINSQSFYEGYVKSRESNLKKGICIGKVMIGKEKYLSQTPEGFILYLHDSFYYQMPLVAVAFFPKSELNDDITYLNFWKFQSGIEYSMARTNFWKFIYQNIAFYIEKKGEM